MKKVFALFLTLISALALMTGCIHEDIGIVLNEDGTGKIAAAVGIDKDTYNQLLGMGFDLLSDAEKDSGETSYEYEYKGKTYIALSETTEYASYEELKQALLDMTYRTDEMKNLNALEEYETEDETEPEEELSTTEPDGDEDAAGASVPDTHIFKEVSIEKTKGLFSKGLIFKAVMNALPKDEENSDQSIAGSVLVTLSVEMPYEIKSAGGNAVLEGKKATFEIEDLTMENTFTVEAENTNTELLIGIVVLLALILLALLLLPKLAGNKDKK